MDIYDLVRLMDIEMLISVSLISLMEIHKPNNIYLYRAK